MLISPHRLALSNLDVSEGHNQVSRQVLSCVLKFEISVDLCWNIEREKLAEMLAHSSTLPVQKKQSANIV